jgi:hypothetical protein
MTIKLGAILALGGRPKEEGGHKPYKLTFDKLTSEEFERLRSRGVKISKFVESKLKQHKDNLDFQVRFSLALKKVNELVEKGEHEGFSFTEYMENLKKEREMRDVARIEYAKAHPVELQQLQEDYTMIHEYIKGFEEWYEKEKRVT